MGVYDAGQISFFDAKMEVTIFAVLILLSYTVLVKNTFTFDEVGFIVLATVYIGLCFHYFIEIRNIETNGLLYIFYACVVIWSTDSGAYFVGKSLGKRKLWPEISPNKTVEGFLGGIVIALILRLFFSCLRTFRFHTWFFWSSRLFCLCSDRSGIWLNQRLSGTMM